MIKCPDQRNLGEEGFHWFIVPEGDTAYHNREGMADWSMRLQVTQHKHPKVESQQEVEPGKAPPT